MTLVVGWRPFPWNCSDPKCNSTKLAIYPGEEPNDPQQIRVVCTECGSQYYTSGEVIDIDIYNRRCRDALNAQELRRLLDRGAISPREFDQRMEKAKVRGGTGGSNSQLLPGSDAH